MNILKSEFTFPSTTGLADIFVRKWVPENRAEVKCIFQIAHGMAEHTQRYEEFAEFLCSKGFAVYANDHVGHGKSVKSKEELGYFGERDGWRGFVSDCHYLTDVARSEYPNLPVIFFGHSMGSFIARAYAERYGVELDGAVFCGTSGKNPGAGLGIKLANIVAKSKGNQFRSELINKVAFGSYNKKINPKRTAFDWLTRDEKVVDQYIADELCGYLFTAAGYRDMFTLLHRVSRKNWYKSLPEKMPVLLIAGSMDPVGDYSKGIEQVYDDLQNAGCKKVKIQLFENDRHEILNELDKEDVFNFVADWAANQIRRKRN